MFISWINYFDGGVAIINSSNYIHIYDYIWRFPEMGGGTPKSSILLGFSINYKPTSYWGSPIHGNPHIIIPIYSVSRINHINGGVTIKLTISIY